MSTTTRPGLAPALPALLFYALFYVIPLVSIAHQSFTPGFLSGGESPLTVMRNPVYLRILAFSVWQAFLSTGLTLLAGLPAAFVFARYRFAAQGAWRALAVVPFVMPTVVVAAAFSALLGPRGWLSQALMTLLDLDQAPQLTGTLGAILLAHVFYNVGLVLRVVGGFLANADTQIEEAARVDGAGRWQVMRHVTFPLALPAIGASAALTFLFTFTSFGVVLLLGGIQHATLEVAIYQSTAQLLRLDVSTSLALLQLVVTLALGLVSSRLQELAGIENAGVDLRRTARALSERLLVGGVLAMIVLLIGLPLLSMVWRSIASEGDPLAYFRALGSNTRNSFFFDPPLVAVGNSLAFAALTTLLAAGLGLPLAYALARRSPAGRVGEALLLLPVGTSAITLGLGYFVGFDRPPLDLRASPILLPLAHTMIALPFFVRAILPALRALDPQLREAAASEGASGWRIIRSIELPLIAPVLAAGAVFAFSISLGEFGAALLISRPEWPTLPVAIFRFLGQPGALNYGQAMAMSVLLMLVTGAGAWLVERLAGEASGAMTL